MKISKIIIHSVFVALFTFSSIAMATSAPADLYASQIKARALRTVSAAQREHATEIYVQNNSNELVFVEIPGTSIRFAIFPGDFEEIYSDTYFDTVEIMIKDFDGTVIYHQNVANHTLLTIDYNTQSSKMLMRTSIK